MALTAAVRDLHRTYPGQFLTDLRNPFVDLWRHNPYLTPISDRDREAEIIDCDYPLIHSANQTPCHFLQGFVHFLNEKLGVQIALTQFKGDLHLSAEERAKPSLVESLCGAKLPYWIIAAGGKFDLTIKWWSHERWQAVVDRLRDRFLLVQVGSAQHFHPRLDGALDLRGSTSLRQLIHLVHHAEGVLCPVTCLMHLAAAVPRPEGRDGVRPCVVVAGGREPAHWEAYPGHRFLQTVGLLRCCESGGCWRRRVVPLGDGSESDQSPFLCEEVTRGLPRCMDMISVEDVVKSVESYLPGGRVRTLSASEVPVARAVEKCFVGTALDADSVTKHTALMALERFVPQIPPPSTRFRGRGIVMAASGAEYFTCAWVCIRMLRRLGCTLPIELWHRDSQDWCKDFDRVLEPYGVRVREADPILQREPADIGHPFALKPFALVHSAFRELLWLDADQVPVQNPEFLFHQPEFRRSGAVFWPDYLRFPKEHPMWGFTGVPYRDEPEVQAGELLIDKSKHWKPLRLALWFNEHHRFFYRHMNGDKDTFRFAWHKLGAEFVMAPHPIHTLAGTMCQHDFEGRRLFQHRNRLKWSLKKKNVKVEGFEYQEDCLEFVESLRHLLASPKAGRSARAATLVPP